MDITYLSYNNSIVNSQTIYIVQSRILVYIIYKYIRNFLSSSLVISMKFFVIKLLSKLLIILVSMLGVQYEVHIQYQPDVKAKLDIVHSQHNWFSGWSVPNIVVVTTFYLIYIAFYTTLIYTLELEVSIPSLSIYFDFFTKHTTIYFNKPSIKNPILQ